MAALYEKNTRISIPTYDGLFAMVQSYFRMQLGDKPAALLVAGAGGGNEISAWGPYNPAWTFTGVDPSEKMLKIAQQKAVQLGMQNRVNLIHGTIEDLPQPDFKFDAASCILVLHFVYELEAKLNLLRTVKANLKPGAPFVVVSAYGDRDGMELQDRLSIWKSFWLDAGHPQTNVDEMVNSRMMSLSFLPEAEIEQLLTEAGFRKVTRFFSTVLMAGWICHAE
ncbi:methylase [Bacillus sp. V3-13]|nr:methylase [Bacillus sp. V3-13]